MPAIGATGRLRSQGRNNIGLSLTHTNNINQTSDSFKPLSPLSDTPAVL